MRINKLLFYIFSARKNILISTEYPPIFYLKVKHNLLQVNLN
jgi:hypothetical protein